MSMVKCEHHARSFSTIADEDGPSFLFEFHCFLWSYPQVSGLDGLKQHRCKTICMYTNNESIGTFICHYCLQEVVSKT